VTLSSNAGPLNIGHQNALGTGSFVNQTANFTTLTNTSGAGISLSNSNYTINSSLIFGGSTTANNMNTGAGAFDLVGSDRILSVSNGVTVTIGGSISGDLRKDNTGTLILAGNGANLTRIRVTTGNLQLTGSTASTTSLTMGHQSGTQVGRFILGSTASAVNQTFGSLRTEGSAQTSQAVVGGNASISTLTINQTTNTTYAGILGGSGTNENQLALTKVGIGSLSLSGTNTYTGVTQVQGGTLEVAAGGSLATGSAVSVSNSGSELAVNGTVGGTLLVNTSTTLSGVGTIIGATTIHGTHNPGNSPGIQTFSNGLTYSNTAILNAEFVGNTLGIRGTDFDGINVTGGNLSIDSLATLNLLTSNVDYTLASWDVSRNFTIIDFSGAGSSSGQFTLNTSAAGLFASEGAWSLSNTNHDIFLSWTPIPEPHTTLLGSLGALMLLRRKR
jgi:autotransporter-associated beta strand protein